MAADCRPGIETVEATASNSTLFLGYGKCFTRPYRTGTPGDTIPLPGRTLRVIETRPGGKPDEPDAGSQARLKP